MSKIGYWRIELPRLETNFKLTSAAWIKTETFFVLRISSSATIISEIDSFIGESLSISFDRQPTNEATALSA
uniref:Uncharacterized protein n=1 Tax=Arundo donax TaxID=35708 RepID=A0A0A9BZ45_ARUDO